MNEFAKLDSLLPGFWVPWMRSGWAWLGRPLGPGARTGAVDAFGIDSAAVLAPGACAAELAARLRRYAQTAAASQMWKLVCVLRHTQASPRRSAPRRPGSRPRPQGPAEPRLETLCQFQRRQTRGCGRSFAIPAPRCTTEIPHDVSWQRSVGPGPAARLSGAEQRSGAGPLVCAEGHTQASSSSLRQLFERSERSERSEFCRRAGSASSAGQSAKPTARVARCGAGAHRPFPARHPHKTQEHQKRSPP